jgi:pimeloyl-ACP methyl ester carboxylesterase
MSAMMRSARARHLAIVVALLSTFSVESSAQAGDTAKNPPPPIGTLVDVGGYRVHLYCTGTGSPTVVIVGAGYSFDWGLVQPEVAGFTRVCSYDHSGTAWSDAGPKDSCPLRVSEVHMALTNAGIAGPYVLVGHSLGGLIVRLYAAQYPNDVAGIVFVDHALAMLSRRPPHTAGGTTPTPKPPTLPPGARISMGMEDDPNFSKMAVRDRELHRWWTAQARDQAAASQDSVDMLMDCIDQTDAVMKDRSHPLGNKPIVDVTAGAAPPLPPPVAETWRHNYAELQAKLMSLSENSKQLVAENSGHFIIVDRSDVVIDAIRRVVRAFRENTKL